MECPAPMERKRVLDLVRFMRRVIVEDHVDGLDLGHLAFNAVEETDEVLMPMVLNVSGDDRSVDHVERGEQRCRAMTLVIVGHGACKALLHRQARLSAVKGLDLRLLV